MKKIFSAFLVLGFLFGGNAYASDPNLILKCRYLGDDVRTIYFEKDLNDSLYKVLKYNKKEIVFEANHEWKSSIYKFNRDTKILTDTPIDDPGNPKALKAKCNETPEELAAQSALDDELERKNLRKIVKSLDPVCQNSTDDFDTIKFCLEKHLFYNQEPLNPGILNTLLVSLADSGDIIISINLRDASGSNQYCCKDDTTELNDGRASVRIDYPDGNGFFIYSYLGATDNGAMVTQILSSGGGSGIFSDLLITKVKKRLGANFNFENSPYLVFDKQQIILEKLLSVPLGDRQETSITIKGNSVTINDKTINIPSH